ncbi:enoyl-CoA hydratase [Mycobacterium sp. PS03-16]|uniref:enoyl-CoA hydratase n=1 Tax=Mycobacterium sp. PS03-16 TaxID=2559611 RepID=UPI001073C9CB|nr:enoyl-CoA hydratase [Mycobacterium sp. PS03-16]TFV60339.1 enoyl-CoA hydratase [Mycobacterium sp. PS03-16]
MREFVGVHTHPEQPGVATLLLSRPPTNALTRQIYRELASAAAEVSGREDVDAVVLFGGHEIFCAGDDVPALRALSPAERAAADEVARAAVAAVAAIPKPTVAAVTGYALGSGLTLALAADWRVAGDNVKVGSTEVLAGLAPRADATARLARAAGLSRAKDLVFSGRFVGAQEALALGLVDTLATPDGVYDAALAWLDRLGDHPPQVLAAAKASFAG